MTPRLIQDDCSKASHSASSPPFEASAIALGRTIQSSFKATEDLVIGVYAQTSLRRKSLRVERDAVTVAAIISPPHGVLCKTNCMTLFAQRVKCLTPRLAPSYLRISIISTCSRRRCYRQVITFGDSYVLNGLVASQMAYDTSHLLQVAQRIAAHHEASPLRFLAPRLTWLWLGVAPRTFIMDEYGAHVTDDVIEADTTLSTEEVQQGMASVDQRDEKMGQEVSCLPDLRQGIPTGPQLSLKSLPRCVLWTLLRFWNHPITLRLRLGA